MDMQAFFVRFILNMKIYGDLSSRQRRSKSPGRVSAGKAMCTTAFG
jgi:hypothetical protein